MFARLSLLTLLVLMPLLLDGCFDVSCEVPHCTTQTCAPPSGGASYTLCVDNHNSTLAHYYFGSSSCSCEDSRCGDCKDQVNLYCAGSRRDDMSVDLSAVPTVDLAVDLAVDLSSTPADLVAD